MPEKGVYILVTKGARRGRKEYRVACADDIGVIYGDDLGAILSGSIDKDAVLRIFGKSTVFSDKKIALGYAIRVAEEVGCSEKKERITNLHESHFRFPQE